MTIRHRITHLERQARRPDRQLTDLSDAELSAQIETLVAGLGMGEGLDPSLIGKLEALGFWPVPT